VSVSTSVAVSDWLDMFWRRRYIILVPLIVCSLLGLFSAYSMPRTYVARAMFMLQEAEQGPLVREPNTAERSNDIVTERVVALQTLLRSERVLKTILSELSGGRLPQNQKALELELARLKDSITLQQLSSEFLELRLRGAKSAGLGRDLETVMAVLFESLIAPDRNVETASRLVFDRRSKRLVEAEAAMKEFLQLHPEFASREIAASDPRKCAVLPISNEPAAPKNESAASTTRTESLPCPPAQKTDAPETNEAAFERLSNDVIRSRATQAFIGLRTGQMTGEQALGILRAPGRILVIDAPRDPEFPLLSRSLVAMLGALAGLVLGFGCALLAELVDTRVRTPKQLEALIRAPVIARLPFDRGASR
jgi:capsular polysaccharide biosynthesis protein